LKQLVKVTKDNKTTTDNAMSVAVSSKSRTEEAYGIKQIGDLEYEGLKPLGKPQPKARGVYGGNLCGQAIVVAMQTVDKDFTPHSLHSYFVAAGDDSQVCQYKVEAISTGKNFANRLVKCFQQEKLKYVVMISLTKRNSIKKTAQSFENTGKGPRPFEYQLPPTSNFYKYKPEDVPNYNHAALSVIEHKLMPEFYNLEEQLEELKKSPGERDLSFFIRLNDKPDLDTAYRYGGMGSVSDSLYLASVTRILHLSGDNKNPLGGSGGNNKNFFSISLDHSIYFHDDDFNPTSWLYFSYSSPRFSNNRVLFQGGYYNQKGKLVASISQEGLVFFKEDAELKAKL